MSRYLLIITAAFFILQPATAQAAVLLPVPFTTQAPTGDWRQPFADACEEAVITMAENYYHKTALTPAKAHTRILELVRYEIQTFGFHRDTNAVYTERLIDEKSKIWGRRVLNPTIDDITAEIDAGRPVIFPAYTPELRNPHFRRPSNPYHVILIVGYDEVRKQFIAHDPGTRFGKNYRYPMAGLMKANHDLPVGKNVGQGAAVVIFTEP